jgi:hypothetical protein
MESNIRFPSPDISIGEIKTSILLLQEERLNALKGNKEARLKCINIRKKLEKLIRINALYVDRIADGDKEVISSSGYFASKQPQPVKRPVFKVIYGDKDGSVILKRKAVQGAVAYIYQYVEDPLPEDEKQWIYANFCAQTKCVIKNLESGKKYWFRVFAINRKERLPWCNPIAKIVQ